MNILTTDMRAAIIRALVEGCSVRSTVRMTGASKKAVLRLLVDMGTVCQEFHNERVRGIKTERLQCDEPWAFVGAKQKQVDAGADAHGDIWLWVALDADMKLAITWALGDRSEETASGFIHDLASRLTQHVQITTDGLGSYFKPILDAFGALVDYAQLIKLYGQGDDPEHRYSPATCIGTRYEVRTGDPDPDHISTSYVERQNPTVRMGCRRYTRLTNAFSTKVENHAAAVAVHYTYYNFCRVHQTLRVTPAMEAGLTDHVWEIEELVGLLEAKERKMIEAGALKRGPYRPRVKSEKSK